MPLPINIEELLSGRAVEDGKGITKDARRGFRGNRI